MKYISSTMHKYANSTKPVEFSCYSIEIDPRNIIQQKYGEFKNHLKKYLFALSNRHAVYMTLKCYFNGMLENEIAYTRSV